MAERSTAAVDVADSGGEQPPTAGVTADGPGEKQPDETGGPGTAGTVGTPDDSGAGTGAAAPADTGGRGEAPPPAPELHSGHKLARRYRLEECVTRLDGFSSWRAVDEKLRRAVGVHVLPADHPRARPVLAAARSAALLGDPRFVQVLDAVEDNDLVYVVHEWLPDAVELTAVLASGPLEAHEAYQLVSQVSQAMAAAHREGLSHLRLNPGSVLRTESGQYRIRGLAVMAALRGVSSDRPQRTDTEAIGALLYAALTQRWPYESDAFGLSGLPKGVGLIAPDQVRAGVHRGLSDLAMRALVNEGATASREVPPCTTPEELAEAISAMPRIRPPDPAFGTPESFAPAAYPRPYRHGGYGPQPGRGAPARAPRPSAAAVTPPPPLQSRTGRVLKWAVSGLLIAALGLGSWQLADTLLKEEHHSGGASGGQHGGDGKISRPASKPLRIASGTEYYPDGTPQHVSQAPNTYDGDASTYWATKSFKEGPRLNPAVKEGVGLVYDLGAPQKLTGASISLRYGGDYTSVALYATDSLSSATPLSSMRRLAATRTSSTTAKLTVTDSSQTRYVVVWMTEMPYAQQDTYSRPGYKQAITDVTFTG
ncbi:protein kinase family protein [Streptomyces sp. B1866]|uniref:protein kinase family protein n=1 Tax=Streptomyces sp. B1866 TaxID=3075431 RepID=UPI00288D9CF8|nr:protein kinase family protein [Streptomyces sp. B1866]MDT3395271.1 protein kinase family protein [Streptomyces sp. B1866]